MVSVSEKFSLGKKSRFRFWEIWSRKKSICFGFGKFGIVKKVSVSVSAKILVSSFSGQEDNCHPHFFFFFWRIFLGFFDLQLIRTSRMGRRRCLMRWSWSTSSRRCVTRWSWSTSPVFSFEFLGDTNTYGNCNGWMGQQFRTFP